MLHPVGQVGISSDWMYGSLKANRQTVMTVYMINCQWLKLFMRSHITSYSKIIDLTKNIKFM